MKIVFASAHPYLPQIAGGSQSNTHEMVLELAGRGHDVAILAGLTGDGWIGARGRMLLKLTGRKTAVDRGQSYPVFRAWHAWEGARDVLRAFRPDVVVAQSGGIFGVAKAFRDLGVPVVIYLHNVEFDDHGGPIGDWRDAVFVANSQFTADRYRDAFGISSTVVNPLFQPQRYEVESSREHVLFVNPHPSKGVDIALALAEACPDIPFDFVESWTLSDEQGRTLSDAMAGLPNVAFHRRGPDMRPHYGRARVVLVPSRWEETWGRVASEAHYSGIPVLATRIGGLSEAVGPGGRLVDQAAPLSEWVDALRQMWRDDQLYERMSAAALAYSRREALQRRFQLDTMEALIAGALADAPARAVPA